MKCANADVKLRAGNARYAAKKPISTTQIINTANRLPIGTACRNVKDAAKRKCIVLAEINSVG